MSSSDIGPGNCLIDNWMRIKMKKNYDKNGETAESGKVNQIILFYAMILLYKFLD